MHKIENLENKIKIKMEKIGYVVDSCLLNPSNRPDLGDYQYNGAMSLAKIYHDSPINIATKIKDSINFKPVSVPIMNFGRDEEKIFFRNLLEYKAV